jgi:hypothetical protein
MYVAAMVKRHFFALPKGTIVCRRDLLPYGTINAVDQILRKLVDREVVVRLANGVFVYPEPGAPLPSAREVAEAKIAAFARHRQRVFGQTPGEVLETESRTRGEEIRSSLVVSTSDVLIYEVDGCSSSFRVHSTADRPGVLVQLRRRAMRKMYLDHTVPGRAIKELWRMGRNKMTEADIRLKLEPFSRDERKFFLSAQRWMTGWMSDTVHRVSSFAATGTVQKESIQRRVYDAATKLILIPETNPLFMQA